MSLGRIDGDDSGYAAVIETKTAFIPAPDYKGLSSAPSGEDGLDRGPVAPGDTVTATIADVDQVDSFTVDLVAGETYVFSLRGSGDSPLADAYLSLLGPDSTEVAYDDDGGAATNSLITYTATETGTFTLVASAYPASGLTGDYTVDVRQLGTDSVADDFTTTTELTEGVIVGALETSGDSDMYVLHVTAGTVYGLTLDGGWDYASDYGQLVDAHELDTVLSVYDADGNLLFSNDDISAQDYSSALEFLAEEDATYYVQATAYKGPVAGYTLGLESVRLSDLDPLAAIDWGSALPSTAVSVYFAAAGEAYDGYTSLGWNARERQYVMTALQTWAAVTDLSFTVTTDPSAATFHLVTTNGLAPGVLGYMNPPGEPNEGVGVFARNSSTWSTPGALSAGGYGFYTIVHEAGHALGLAHPHDNGGTSEVMPGVTSPFNSYGVFDLNQGVYTVMSYNPSFATHPGTVGGFPPGSPSTWGLQSGPGAFDIALLQQRYGVNENRHSGNDVYELPTGNGPGTYYLTIWDTGGNDTIVANGNTRATIDLTAATLDYTATGGGVVSFVAGIFGGFTIAGGVTIENATGGNGRDVLIGNAAANRLDGRGNADMMIGRDGNDTYVVDERSDTVIEVATGGYDTVETSLNSYSLADFVEQLRLTGTGNIGGFGNALDNRLWGNAGNNLLNGAGGADYMRGGAGNDLYVVDNAGDVVIELDGEGDDRVQSSVSYSIEGRFVESLALTGTANINATGNGLDNRLAGNAGDNLLDGRGGADEMRGGQGNDVYIVDNAGDRVIEALGEGNDTVQSSVSFNLAGQQIETLILTGGAAINGIGNSLGNVIQGNKAANLINGGDGHDTLFGGKGADTLIGGSGSDVFWFDTALGNGNVDTIADFAVGEDAIYLEHAIFSALDVSEALSPEAFRAGTAAQDADDHIIYDRATGRIWYDADGVGGAAGVLFAQVAAGTALTSLDFVVSGFDS